MMGTLYQMTVALVLARLNTVEMEPQIKVQERRSAMMETM